MSLELVREGQILTDSKLNYLPNKMRLDALNSDIVNYSENDSRTIYRFSIHDNQLVSEISLPEIGSGCLTRFFGFDQDYSGKFMTTGLYDWKIVVVDDDSEIINVLYYPSEFNNLTVVPN